MLRSETFAVDQQNSHGNGGSYPVFLVEAFVWVCDVQLHCLFLGRGARVILKAVHLGSEETLE